MPTWKNSREAQDFMDNYFMRAARIVADGTHWYDYARREHVRTYDGRPWFRQQCERHQLHPAVYLMMVDHKYRAENWQQLLLEWPHRSLTDPNRLAYTRDERSAMHGGDSDIKAVVTTIGKYLTRHFPDAPDNLIRDIAAQFTYGGLTTLTNDMDKMVHAVIHGPRSCMSSSFDMRCSDGERRHPYEVYDPSLGWGMAVRTDTDGMVLGRCLVHESDDGKGFVRSYKRERDYSSSSGADEAIEAYLKGLGYAKWRGWPDHIQVKRYPLFNGGYLMPYIDGGSQHVIEDDYTFRISEYDGWEACNTNGRINGYDHTCENCGAGFHDGDGGWTGVYEDNHVCDSCLEDDYTYAYSRRGNEYYIHNDDVINVNGDSYDVNYLDDNDIVELHDGEYEHRDHAVFIESCDEYYRVDDDDICYAEDTGRYELTEDCWCCTESGKWYTDDEDYVEVDGDRYHPDDAPEQETNDTETN